MPNEAAARSYPIAPGNSITFIDENAPYCYTMTMGFSQFDRPKFEKFRLVKEEDTPPPQLQKDVESTTEIEQIKAEIQQIKSEIYILKGQKVIDDVKPTDRRSGAKNMKHRKGSPTVGFPFLFYTVKCIEYKSIIHS